MTLVTLKTRPEFLRVRGGSRWSGKSFVLEGKRRVGVSAQASPAGEQCGDLGPRFGFTVTKKLGNAVIRNRIRRRLREAARLLALPGEPPEPRETALRHEAIAVAGSEFDYVVVARVAALTVPFAELSADMARAIMHIDGKAKNKVMTVGRLDDGRATEHPAKTGASSPRSQGRNQAPRSRSPIVRAKSSADDGSQPI